jgi:hypothetical protein
MSGAIFSLLLGLLAAPDEREYDGAVEAVEAAARPTRETPPNSALAPETSGVPDEPNSVSEDREVPPVPSPANSPAPAATPAPAPEPAPPVQRPPAPDARAKPTPKWWGPFPRPRITGFGGPVAHFTGLKPTSDLARKFALMLGIAAGMTIRQRVSLGASVMWLLNPVDAGATAVGSKQRLNVNYGGLLLDVALVKRDRLDLSLAGLVGGGGACLQNPDKGTCYDRTAFFVGQPGLAAHIRLLPVVRLVFGLGYRFVVARSWSGPTGAGLGAPVGSAMLELGWF